MTFAELSIGDLFNAGNGERAIKTTEDQAHYLAGDFEGIQPVDSWMLCSLILTSSDLYAVLNVYS